MRLILREDMQGLGKRGDIIEVADGYGRNYLLPKGKAIAASDGAVEQAARMRRARDLRDASDREAATTVASTLVPKVITITQRAGEGGKLFGSVGVSEIVGAAAHAGVEIDRRTVQLDEPIREVGDHSVMIVLHTDVTMAINVSVVEDED